MSAVRLEVFSDVVCRWCYIGVQGAQPSETLLEFLRQAADQPVSA